MLQTQLRLDDLRRAWEAQDPDLVRLVLLLAEQPDEKPKTPVREGAPTFDRFVQTISRPAFRRQKSKDEQAHYRIEHLKQLEASDAEVPLPDRLRLHQIILQLWNDNSAFARGYLLRIIAGVKLTYGPWRALKRIFKEAEAKNDTEVYGALAARFDAAFAGGGATVSRLTLGYLARRGWRYLRTVGRQMPVSYPDVAVDFLAPYADQTRWGHTWIVNHVFFHDAKQYGRSHFRQTGNNLLKDRAFGELWRRTPRPLFALLERAQSDRVREFATTALRTDFRTVLREVEPAWVARLVTIRSKAVDEFVVWVLSNVPRFEQAAFRKLGLHEAVLLLFDSPAVPARAYAAEYARTHARDLPVAELVRLMANDNATVRALAADLLQARDPRTTVGLDAWGQVLETAHGHELAATVLRKHFGARELTPTWFADRLLSGSDRTFNFASALLPHVHPLAQLGAGFFTALIDRIDDFTKPGAARACQYALNELVRFDLNALDAEFLRRLLVHPIGSDYAARWIDEGRLKTQPVPAGYWKALAFHPDFDADPWLTSLRQSERTWARHVQFTDARADRVLVWLRDVRRFAPADLGFDWLLKLAARSEPRYHDFAVGTLIKSFAPADFAGAGRAGGVSPPREGEATDGSSSLRGLTPPARLDGASFLFTGKLATMQRKEAEDKVRGAGGEVATAVTPKLGYLVIGDEGSPLYGHGTKGAKQTRAEELNASGANIRIISETAFLQMLAGRPAGASADATLAGCERLWDMLTGGGPADAFLSQLALKYIRRHHPDICLAETDRPVDPGAEIPPAFLTFERVRPLFNESRKHLRDFALELAKWEFARWSPSATDIIALCELPHPEVRRFVGQALLADDGPEHRRYRIDGDKLTPAAVYSFCESPEEETRTLGMELIRRSPRLQLPEELFRLTESPDRKVRGFVIRALWSLYRDRGITADWKPALPPQPELASKKAKALDRGPGAPLQPEQPPSGRQELGAFLRRILFELPPGRLPPRIDASAGIHVRLKPLPARKAKLSLVEMLRDLALEHAELAAGVLPALEEFMTSQGKGERDACLVAVTRIRLRGAAR